VTAEWNTIKGNAAAGITAQAGSTAVILNNEIYSNGTGVIISSGSSVYIANNTIAHNLCGINEIDPEAGDVTIKENIVLSDYTYFGIGGPARMAAQELPFHPPAAYPEPQEGVGHRRPVCSANARWGVPHLPTPPRPQRR